MYERTQKAATPTTVALLLIALAVVELAVRPRVAGDAHLVVDGVAVSVAVTLLALTVVSFRNR
jgi:hypothetical protein